MGVATSVSFSESRRDFSRIIAVSAAGILVAASILVTFGPAHAATADIFEYPNTYRVTQEGTSTESGTVAVIGHIPSLNTPVVFPGTVTSNNVEYRVTSIADGAMKGSGAYVKSVTLPDGLLSIGEEAFAQIPSLASITLPEGLLSIGRMAFSQAGLESITIPDSVTDIGYGAFTSNAAPLALVGSLTSVTLKEGLLNIGELAFSHSSSLKSIEIPASVSTIGASAFAYSGLTSVTLNDGLTTIGEGAFIDSSLTALEIPSSVTSIGPKAFGASMPFPLFTLPSVTFAGATPATFTDAGITGSLGKGTGLTVHYLDEFGSAAGAPNGFDFPTWRGYSTKPASASVPPITFTSANGIEYSVTGDGKVKVTGYSGASTSVEIPSTIENDGTTFDVTAIGDTAFMNKGMTSITLNAGLLSIGEGAFFNNNLEAITIPASVTSLQRYAFKTNPLTSVTFAGAAPTTFTVAGATGSLGTGGGLTVHYLTTFGVDAGATGGFTSSTWKGYTSIATASIPTDPTDPTDPGVFTTTSALSDTGFTGAPLGLAGLLVLAGIALVIRSRRVAA